ncbi:MAG TPA: hypothetical protein VGN83_10320 [Falsiroseomonas sp.]|jgi:hypothetical protein|nr:hypothetical protein [Falsiroseomonas sp.]
MSDGRVDKIDMVLGALERLVTDLRQRTEEAESRAAASVQQAALERQAKDAEVAARREAEMRAAAAEQSARDAVRRAEIAETTATERAIQLRHELLAAVRAAVEAAQAKAVGEQATRASPRRTRGAEEQEPTVAAQPGAAGRQPFPHRPTPRRPNDEPDYAWIEDDPGPPWWRRVFKQRRY